MSAYTDRHEHLKLIGDEIVETDWTASRGLGRWIYCKYCYKKVKPLLGGINQVICSQCGYGLTPDFFALDNLLAYLHDDDNAEQRDIDSPEARRWLKAFNKREREINENSTR